MASLCLVSLRGKEKQEEGVFRPTPRQTPCRAYPQHRPTPRQTPCRAYPQHWPLLCLSLLLHVLVCNGLLCNYCPLQHKEKNCPNITTECRPQERCYTGRGHYGNLHILSAQGCVSVKHCGSRRTHTYKGVSYSLVYSCCCRDACNLPQKPDNTPNRLLGLTPGPIEVTTDTGCPLNSTLDPQTAGYRSP